MRKHSLYAPRLFGDIELGDEPSRLGGDNAKQWARMTFPGRKIAGQTEQLVTAQSSTQKFEIGTRRIEYGRTFRYSRANETLTNSGRARLMCFGNWVPDGASHPDVDGFYGDLLTAAVVGDKYIDLETATAFAANYFKGGYGVTFNTTFQQFYIVKSDLGNGTYCRCYLDNPLIEAISATQGVEIYCSPYRKIVRPTTDQTYVSFAGISHCKEVASGYYFWLQTRGPAWVTPTDWSTTTPGIAANYRDVYAWIDGTVKAGGGLTIETGYQRIGYLISATESGYGDVLIMLQLE